MRKGNLIEEAAEQRTAALVETRTPGQVLFLAFGGAANAAAGGFFPSGVNWNAQLPPQRPRLQTVYHRLQVTDANQAGVTTITWNAPGAQFIQIRVNSPTGTLFTYDGGSGSMQTGPWVIDGTTFYLIDVTKRQVHCLDNSGGSQEAGANQIAVDAQTQRQAPITAVACGT